MTETLERPTLHRDADVVARLRAHLDRERPPTPPDAGRFHGVFATVAYGHTTDVAAVVSFLAGPEAGYATGAN